MVSCIIGGPEIGKRVQQIKKGIWGNLQRSVKGERREGCYSEGYAVGKGVRKFQLLWRVRVPRMCRDCGCSFSL